ncbi:MAG: hypothetical protein M0008_07300 [Actinomycetota bacterium]|nr:hypothetical protein [Actinomycetota bacterium]
MSPRYVVVDGSNIATEGRSLPSLAQLDEAVREFQREFPNSELTVVVDATFEHRIDETERAIFSEAVEHGEIVFPPAGAIGRGDAFLLRIAEKTGALVLSNDSFQEFHGEHAWLFEKDRLIGGKPVPGVGWIFTPRTPVRGPKSREAVKEAKQFQVRVGSKEASKPMPRPKSPPPGLSTSAELPETASDSSSAQSSAVGSEPASLDGEQHPKSTSTGSTPLSAEDLQTTTVAQTTSTSARTTRAAKARKAPTASLPATSTSKAAKTAATKGRRGRRRQRHGARAEAVNEPLPFITFIAAHRPGETLDGEVESFTSHGAMVMIDGFRCYVPLGGLANPPPQRAREILNRGEQRKFVIVAFDPQRRGVELALPEIAGSMDLAASPDS